ncbi:hypothetical protein V7x_17110 [Crateriforma conspicua]|uniref:Type II secretion system protein G n=1 Tax=Crateriforma conspicua TaxID=2527996 RepID=A0A5C6FYQ3_9PLAN|nr:prepilin-type N-terminal cleavage/methylation domain-containing protein [Crateriforma conspicua]TWU66153.1 hypothetical protein V7x_17110 [Crateriforma conspicua]
MLVLFKPRPIRLRRWRQRPRSAFTLVEIMVVLVVGGLLLGMGASMMATARRSSRIARTQAVISVVDGVIRQRLDELNSLPLPLEHNVARTTQRIPSIPADEAERVRLQMRRDAIRMYLPDRYSDLIRITDNRVTNATNDPFFVLSPDLTSDRNKDGQPDEWISGVWTDPVTIAGPVRVSDRQPDGTFIPSVTVARYSWWNDTDNDFRTENHNVPGQLSAYRARIPRIVPNNQLGFTTSWSPANSPAECLYLIMSTTFISGTSAIEMLPRGHVEDTDGDGVPEIVDAWGVPLGFIRWPVGYVEPGNPAPPTVLANVEPEEYDVFRADFAYAEGSNIPGPPNLPLPRSLQPLVVSAGPDGVFDLRFFQTRSDNNNFDVIYPLETWPNTQAWVGNQTAGRPQNFFYVDPFLRQSLAQNNGAAGAIGGVFDTDGDGSFEGLSDNITNHGLTGDAQ